VTTPRLVIWEGLDAWRPEVARVELGDGELSATGTQLGVEPLPYRLEYALEALDGFVTRSMRVEVTGESWARRLALSYDGHGDWRCQSEEDGTPDLPPPGGDVSALTDALDVDLGLSPLTNLMPLRRAGLHEGPGATDLLAAWISVPDLGLHASRQRYEHVHRGSRGAVVRYMDVGAHAGFTSDLEVDGDGLVRLYPGLARRVGEPR
jgi:uncharacterized protein